MPGASPGPEELAELEALADEIAADEGAQLEDGGQASGGAAAGGGGRVQGAAAGPWVADCWEQATDLNSGQLYWFNRATGVSQWTPPPGWAGGDPHALPAPAAGEAGAAQQQQRGPQAAHAWGGGDALPSSAGQEPGLYYRDARGQLQGPFDGEQLRQWRGMLPMDLPILQLEAGSADEDRGTSPGGGASGPDGGAQGGSEAGGNGPAGGEAKAGAAGPRWTQSELAAVLGDDELLARWRMENPDQAAWPGAAPPAAAYEAELQRGSGQSLAEAVLFGLPAHDEAVAVARVAASSGRSLQEVLEWSRGGDYSVTAYRVAARGRIQAPGATESLYAEASSWADPRQLEQQLARASERRKRALTGEELRQVKQRKQDLKEKKLKAWLFT